MRDLALVLWLIGFPLGCALEDYVRTKERGFRVPGTQDEDKNRLIFRVTLWVIVSVILMYRAT